MLDLISPFISLLWPILAVLGAIAAAWGWGKKKQREGRTLERERAREARDLAADEAAKIRDTAATKPIAKKRKEVSKWEK